MVDRDDVRRWVHGGDMRGRWVDKGDERKWVDGGDVRRGRWVERR